MSAQPSPYRFVAERTLGKLAKWLRLMGFDTLYDPGGRYDKRPDPQTDGRIRLTRTTAQKGFASERGLIFIEADRVFLQLGQVIEGLGLTAADLNLFSRCLKCNTKIVAIDKSEALGLVPDYIFETVAQFSRCNRCMRIFWPGSHNRRVRERIADLFVHYDSFTLNPP